MATRDAVINKRIAAVERIKRQLPELRLRRYGPSVGSEYQHAADLESVADALERRNGQQPQPVAHYPVAVR
jgi:hypothetical protein